MRNFLMPVIVLFLMSCGSDDAVKDFTEANEAEISNYIEENNLMAQRSATGLYYVITDPGSDNRPNANSNVTVAYKGYFTDGRVFDESNADGISFDLDRVIPGWTEGITYFGEGGNGILLIPSRLGYGDSGTRGIPGGVVLIFDIALISIN